MVTFLFFVGTPLLFGLLQFFVTRSGLPRGKKYLPLVLVALTAANELGHAVSAFEVIPFLFYPFLLLISSLLFIFVIPERKR